MRSLAILGQLAYTGKLIILSDTQFLDTGIRQKDGQRDSNWEGL